MPVVFLKLWAWLGPTLATKAGPWLVTAAPLVARLPTVAALKRSARLASYVATLALGAWAASHVLTWWRGDMISQRLADEQAKQKCVTAVEAATLAARESWLNHREETLKQRERAVDEDAKAIAQFETQQEIERAKSKGNSVAVFSSDDVWLRAWTERR